MKAVPSLENSHEPNHNFFSFRPSVWYGKKEFTCFLYQPLIHILSLTKDPCKHLFRPFDNYCKNSLTSPLNLPSREFLLPPVYIPKVCLLVASRDKLYLSNLAEKNLAIRLKITGKKIPSTRC